MLALDELDGIRKRCGTCWVRLRRHRRPPRPPITVPHATHGNRTGESARKDGTAVWFFDFLPIFVLLYAIVEKMHVR